VSNFWVWRGYIHFQMMNQPKDALADYERAVLLGADDPGTHFTLGLTYEALKDCRSVNEFRKVSSQCKTQHCQIGVNETAVMKLGSQELHSACPAQFGGAGS